MAWATVAETLTYTGITVTTAEVAQAQFIVELFSDVTEDSTISTKNLRMLKMAVAYQAAFVTDHPDLFTHVDVSTMLQDGVQFTQGHENAMVLAPLARRAINRLSWRRNRSIKIRKPRRGIRRMGYMGALPSYDSNGAFEFRDRGMWEAD